MYRGFPLNCRTHPLLVAKESSLGVCLCFVFPLAAERPLYSELVDTTLASDTRIRTAPTQLLDDNTRTRIRSSETPIKKQVKFGGSGTESCVAGESKAEDGRFAAAMPAACRAASAAPTAPRG